MKGVILTMALIGSTAVNMNEAFHSAKDATQGVASVYVAAQGIDPYADAATKANQHASFFNTASRLEPMVERVHAVENPYEGQIAVSHVNGQVFGYYSEQYSPKS